MKTPLTFLLSLTFLFLFGCSDSEDTHEVEKYYYDSGELEMENHIKDGGIVVNKKYWKNGKLRYITHYKNDEHDGLKSEWYETGQRKKQTYWKNK